MSQLVSLMYHGLFTDEAEQLRTIDLPDRPYAVSAATFERHLDLMAEAGLTIIDPQALPGPLPARGVVLTFDDGHASNATLAVDILVRRGLKAVFFATSDFIGARPHFCSWGQLRDMAQAGMLIGSHGRTHRFFDDMSDTEASAEFKVSRERLEQGTGQKVDQISFPGGRYKRAQLQLGKAEGYTLFYTSQVGVHREAALVSGAEVSRIAVRQGTDDTRFMAYASAARGTSACHRQSDGAPGQTSSAAPACWCR